MGRFWFKRNIHAKIYYKTEKKVISQRTDRIPSSRKQNISVHFINSKNLTVSFFVAFPQIIQFVGIKWSFCDLTEKLNGLKKKHEKNLAVNYYLCFSCSRLCFNLSRRFTRRRFCRSVVILVVGRGRFRDRPLGLHVWIFGWNTITFIKLLSEILCWAWN